MKKLFIILLLTIPFIGFGQGWEKNYNLSINDAGNSIQQTSDGGYIVTGHIGVLELDIILIKLNSLGDTLWTNSLIETHDQWGNSVKQTNDNGYVIFGTREDNQGDGNIWLVKTDSNGVKQWDQTFGGTGYDDGYSIQQTTDGGYIGVGMTVSFGNGNKDVYLIKTDGNGVEQWNQTFGGNDEDEGRSVQQTTDGGYIVLGLTKSFGNGDSDMYLIKTDSNGIQQWDQTFGGINEDEGWSVQQTTDGGYIICGGTWSFGNGDNDFYLIKTDGNGVEQWNQTFGGINEDEGRSVQQTTDGGFIICGLTWSFGNGSCDVYLIKTDSNGVQQWDQTFGGGNEDEGRSVQQTTDGGFIICGFTDSYSSLNWDMDIYLIKTDSQGNITSTFNIPTPSSNRKLEKVVDILGRETKPKLNNPFIEIYDDGSTEKKIVVE